MRKITKMNLVCPVLGVEALLLEKFCRLVSFVLSLNLH